MDERNTEVQSREQQQGKLRACARLIADSEQLRKAGRKKRQSAQRQTSKCLSDKKNRWLGRDLFELRSRASIIIIHASHPRLECLPSMLFRTTQQLPYTSNNTFLRLPLIKTLIYIVENVI